MYTQSHEDGGRDSSASTAGNGSHSSAWRHLPTEATGTAAPAPPAYEENLQTVLEDSERHLDALWNMLNSQMNRLSSGYSPATEAQALSVPPLNDHLARVDPSEDSTNAENRVDMPDQESVAKQAVSDQTQGEAVTAELSAMPYNFVPTAIPSLVLETESEDFHVEEPAPSEIQAPSADSLEEAEEAEEEHSAVEAATVDDEEPIAVMPESEMEPIPMAHSYHSTVTSETADDDAEFYTAFEPENIQPEAVPMPASITALTTAATPMPEMKPETVEEPKTAEIASPEPHSAAKPFPPVRVESAFRENWMVVTAREAGGVTVLPTVTMRVQSQPNQSLQMRSTALGEMPLGATPLVTIESTEEAGSEPAAMRIEIAYTADAPDMVFEVNAQSEDEVQITMADQSGDLCASWEVSKQKGKYARARATLSRQVGDPEVLVEIQRFREDANPEVWHSLLSFSVVPRV